MFQFTREFIINNLKGNLSVENLNTFKSVDPDTADAVKSKIAVAGDTILIDNLVNIDKKSIHKVYKTAHIPAEKEVIIWTPMLKDIKVGDIVRIIATLYQDDNVVATFASAVPNTGRTVQYEFIATGTTLVEGKVEDLYATMEVTTNTITIKAKDCFTHVGKIEIVKDAVSDSNIGVGTVKVTSVKKGDAGFTVSKEGTPGLGNTAQILRNMRLQTDANLNPYGLDIDERPVPDGEYDMFTVELVIERRNIGHNVMGSVGTSLTTLVFYVAKTVTETFEKLFSGLITPTINDNGTPDNTSDDKHITETGKEPGILLDEE